MATALTEAEARVRAALVDVESYDVFLDLTGDPVRSRTEIRFLSREPAAATFAEVSGSSVRSVVCNGQALDPGAVLAAGRLSLPRLRSRNVLAVEAERPRDGQGLTWSADAGDGAVYLLGSCFPTSAAAVFCCFDQPDLRADLTLTVTAPAGWDCVANGAVTSRPTAGQPGRWRFAAVHGMKPYELAFCGGPYVTAWKGRYRGSGGPVDLSVRCRPALAGSAGLAQAGDLVRQSLQYYERLLGVACPYRKYDVVFAPQLHPLAFSVPGVMAVSESLLQRMAGPGDDYVPIVLAHEAAHLWFGCLVEGRWWDDLWLAEALATYLSYTAAGEALGMEAPWAEFVLREQAAAYHADSLPTAQPVCSPVASSAEAMDRPPAITYYKGASVIRQLAALIGDGALRAGLHDYLIRYGGGAAELADLIGCWSAASGRDLGGWAEQWLRTSGTDMLRPELQHARGGGVRSLAVVQEPPPPGPPARPARAGPPPVYGQEPGPAARPLRPHFLAVGAYERAGGQLRRRSQASVQLAGARAVVPGLAGLPVPAAVVVNDGGLTFARIRFDDRSLRALAACAMDVSDPVTEAVCWNAAWDMTASAELSAAEFADLVARRIGGGRPVPGISALLEHAVTGADYYAVPALRPGLRQRTAAAALAGARQAAPGSRAQLGLAVGFAASAHSQGQLDLLRRWLTGKSRPDGLGDSLILRTQILSTLSARGQATDADLDDLAAADPVGGETHRLTCQALRPDPDAKQAAWTAALSDGQSPRIARAHARGFWAPGQEDLLAAYRDRYFTEALAALSGREPGAAAALAELLFPAILADAATIAATGAAIEQEDIGAALRAMLREHGAILRRVLAARSAATGGQIRRRTAGPR